MIETKHWLIKGINEWRQFNRSYNWVTFTPIQIYFEAGFIHGYEFHLIFLGLGFYIRYNSSESLSQFDEWKKEVENFL